MQKLLYITDESMIGYARRELKTLCDEADCNEIKENAAVVITELASNGIKHAHDSSIIIKYIENSKRSGLEIIYMDKGPGFDVEQVTHDGFSTAGSMGIGLGAIQRLSDECYIYSKPGKGTCIVCRLFVKRSNVPHSIQTLITRKAFEYSHICVAIAGQDYCGDDVAVYIHNNYCLCMVADGLGHGEYAHQAAVLAKDIFYDNIEKEPDDIIGKMHKALYTTRGAAVSIAKIIPDESKVVYAGIGNISGALIGQKRVNMVSHNGTLGMDTIKIQTFIYPWNKNDILIMHSDGISAKWDLGEYQDVVYQDLSLISGVIFRDYHRPKDDASLLILKEV